MSCTDDKTVCPCEPGEELRRFTAADLKAAVLEGQDEDDPGESWYALESGKTVANELYDAEVAAESTRLYAAWSDSSRRDWSGNGPEYAAYREHMEANRPVISSTKQVPWTFKWNGKELPVTIVQDNGGTEGGGEQAHMIYQVCDRLFRLDGSYYSYDGTTWDDDSFREVKAVSKAVTFYE